MLSAIKIVSVQGCKYLLILSYLFEYHSFSRFGKPDRDIVINSLINNRWGMEERFANVFKEGEPFSIRILVLSEYFKVSCIFSF